MPPAASRTTPMTERGFDPQRLRWVPWAFAGAMALVVAVNGVLVWFALSTYTGATQPHAYDRGRGYNAVLAEAERQAALGWRAEIGFAEGRLSVTVRDAAGAPVPGDLAGRLQRPIEGTAIPLAFAPRDAGQWVAEVVPPRPGQWEAQLRLEARGGQHRDLRQRILVP